jgi:riboflavin kinase/FMN adenylyltransferase
VKTFQKVADFNKAKSTIITIGTFDGVHLGHQQILKQLTTEAEKSNLKSLVLTFFPHPRMVLQKESDIKLINTIEEKKALCNEKGIDYLVIQPFNKAFSRYSALEFVRDILVEKLHMKKLIIGYDHQFGKNREGGIEELREFGAMLDFEVVEIDKHELNEIAVSSTKIRKALREGNILLANSYLGHPFTITGPVVSGRKLGRTIHFPTANIHVPELYKLIPKDGVYIVKSTIDSVNYHGMLNIGNRPTVGGTHKTIEVHFFDFDKDIYYKTIQLKFIKRLRDEHKFDGIEGLVKQLQKDKIKALTYIKNNLLNAF